MTNPNSGTSRWWLQQIPRVGPADEEVLCMTDMLQKISGSFITGFWHLIPYVLQEKVSFIKYKFYKTVKCFDIIKTRWALFNETFAFARFLMFKVKLVTKWSWSSYIFIHQSWLLFFFNQLWHWKCCSHQYSILKWQIEFWVLENVYKKVMITVNAMYHT